MKYKDYYALLEIKRNATQEEIKRAYRHMAKIYHPDSNIGDKVAEEKTIELNEAYEVLSDEKRKKKYDSLINRFNFIGAFEIDTKRFDFLKKKRNVAIPENRAFSDFYNLFFAGSTPDFDENMFDITKNDDQELLFRRGEDIEVEYEISMEEAFYGTDAIVPVRVLGNKIKEYEITIPEGLKSGDKIKVLGKGQPGTIGAPPGDLYVKIKIKRHDMLKLSGRDLEVEVPITPWEAVLGGRAIVSTIDGKLDVKIPAGVQTGNRLRIQGRGYKKEEGRGDLLAYIKIVVPTVVSEEEKNLYKKLGATSRFSPRLSQIN